MLLDIDKEEPKSRYFENLFSIYEKCTLSEQLLLYFMKL